MNYKKERTFSIMGFIAIVALATVMVAAAGSYLLQNEEQQHQPLQAEAALNDWTLQVKVKVAHPDAGDITITVNNPNYRGTAHGTSAIFAIPGDAIEPGEGYQVCASQEGVASACKTFIHNPGDAEVVTINLSLFNAYLPVNIGGEIDR